MGKRARRPAAAADKGDNRAVSPAALADFSDRAADKGNNRARPPAALADFSDRLCRLLLRDRLWRGGNVDWGGMPTKQQSRQDQIAQ